MKLLQEACTHQEKLLASYKDYAKEDAITYLRRMVKYTPFQKIKDKAMEELERKQREEYEFINAARNWALVKPFLRGRRAITQLEEIGRRSSFENTLIAANMAISEINQRRRSVTRAITNTAAVLLLCATFVGLAVVTKMFGRNKYTGYAPVNIQIELPKTGSPAPMKIRLPPTFEITTGRNGEISIRDTDPRPPSRIKLQGDGTYSDRTAADRAKERKAFQRRTRAAPRGPRPQITRTTGQALRR